MPSSFGSALRVSVFGQSHSEAIGCVVEGLPSGLLVDMDALGRLMARRAPGQGPWATPRKEADLPRIVSGLNADGATCGAPLALVIENTNTRSGDYDELRRVPRPGHADLPAQLKWHGNQDVPGGGHFSGRLTAPLCAAGGIALQALATRGVRVRAHLAEVAGVRDEPFEALDNSPDARARLQRQMDRLEGRRGLPVIDDSAEGAMLAAIDAARRGLDSVGGVVECVATGLPAGMGSPMFDGLENSIARAAFGIPAVKGIEFGRGFGAARLRGSEDNDPYHLEGGRPVPSTNNAGGALGGLSTGAAVLFRLAVKPTSSIGRPQDSVDLVSGEPARLGVRGRHDPCIAPRAVPVAEAVCALALLDSWLAFPPEGAQFSLGEGRD
ncbi:chorismate synthase [Olsenella phocaeensis]|uniref:chorismate synthase n=1 Tax=Olsenella phocaeensis TaxID=1852385 RepID=UPI003A8D5588